MKKIHTKFNSFNENVGSNQLSKKQLKDILEGYLAAVIWTNEDRLEEDCEENDLDCDLTVYNFSDESKFKSMEDIKKFISLCPEGVKEVISKEGCEQLGHDIHLTRNGHGVGFSDRNYDLKDELQKCAKSLQETHVFFQDGEVHIE